MSPKDAGTVVPAQNATEGIASSKRLLILRSSGRCPNGNTVVNARVVCTENLNPGVVVVKSAQDGA